MTRLISLIVIFLLSPEGLIAYKIEPHATSNTHQGYGNYDPHSNGEYRVIREFIRDGSMVFDVGANIGEWSAYTLKSHKNLSIHAFEPTPDTCIIYKKNVPTTILRNLALSDTSGITTMRMYPQNSGLNTIHQRDSINYLPSHLISIITIPLDGYCLINRIPFIDFLKIDTEGHEYHILKGAVNLLSSQAIAFIQFEYGSTSLDAHITLKEIFTLLTTYGYSLYRICSDKLIHIQEWHDALENFNYANYLASSKPL